MSADPTDPIVLIHGFSASPVIWTPILPALKAAHCVLAVTLDGHLGGLRIPPGTASVATIADGVERNMDAAGFEQAHLVGNSLGGWLALELARRGRAISVVAIAPGGSWEPDSSEDEHLQEHLARNGKAARQWLPLLKPAVRLPALRRVVFAQMVNHGNRIPAKIAEQMLVASARCPVHAELRLAMFAPGNRLEVDGIDCPILLVWGADDALTPAGIFGRRIRTRLPNAEWRELPDAGHIPMFDAPGSLAELILRFVTSHRT